MQIHELNTFVGTPGDGDYLAIDNGSETSKVELKGAVEALAPAQPTPAGIVQMYAGSSAPNGWLMCNGQAVSRTTYAELFAAIGTTYGAGDGSSTFNVPDMRNRFPVGAGSTYSRNSKGGSDSVTLTESQIPAHTHGNKSLSGEFLIRKAGAGGNSVAGASGTVSIVDGPSSASANSFQGYTSSYVMQKVTINASHEHSSVGGESSHENRPPYIGIYFIISTGK